MNYSGSCFCGAVQFTVSDKAANIPFLGGAFVSALWRNGWGRIQLSKAGSCLARSLADATVWSPERLDLAGS